MSVVMHRGRIHTPAGADTTAMVVSEGVVAWLGSDDAVSAHIGPTDTVLDLGGALVTPAFVDAHVHCTATGLALTGLDLSAARSGTDVLDRVAAFARSSGSAVLLGSGWDDTAWTQPTGADTTLPTADQLSRAAGGRTVYLARVDAHSALVSSDLLGGDVTGLTGYQPTGRLRHAAHDAARTRALARLGPGDRRRAQLAALARAASLGIGAVHEMAGPSISSADDLRLLLAGAPEADAAGPEVVGYWGELGGIEAALDLGAAGAAGDLFCDGALGSHTAALHAPYADEPTHRPGVRFTAREIGGHIAACTRSGLQAGFHAIGDAAIDAVLDGMELAAAELGAARVHSAGHRLEHAEMVTDPRRLAASGLLASVQPAFDAAWGGPDGMYARRLGAARAARLNDFAALSAAGVALAMGSDAPVTALDPWATVRAAAYHRTPPSSISVRAAFLAHTRGGWRAARREHDGSGVLAVGHPATYAIWDASELVVDEPDERVSRWSTEARSDVAALPDLAPGRPLPRCRQTVVRGRVIFDATD